MGNPREVDLTAWDDLDRVDRVRWSKAVAYAFKIFPAEVLHAIAAGDERTFIERARPVLAHHGFRYEDYQRMYALIKQRSERLLAKGILVGGGEDITLGGPDVVIN